MSAPRIQPLQPPYSETIQNAFDIIMPKGMEPLNIFRTVAHNSRVLSRMVKGGLLDQGSITLADRELVILRSCAVCKAGYEWGVHAAGYGSAAGFSEAQIQDTCAPQWDCQLWTDAQQILFEMVDELHQHATLSDVTWQRLGNHYEQDQLIELIMLAGLYHAVSFVVNALQIEKEWFAPAFP